MRIYALGHALLLAALSSSAAFGASGRPVADSLLPVLSLSKVTGSVDGAQPIHISVSLQPRHLPELQAFCNSVSDPLSPNYHQFMTPDQVGENFGASAQDVDAVVNFLKSQGMKITLITPNRMSVLAQTTVAGAEKAFSTHVAQFTGPDAGSGKPFSFRANTSPLMVPANLSVVTNIQGVSTYNHPMPFSTTLSPALARGLYRTAPSYGNNFRGQGRKIGISNWDGWKISNAQGYISQFGLPVPGGGSGSNIHDVIVGSGGQGLSGAGEGDLDVQMELAIAPLADIYVFDNGGAGNDLIGVLSTEVSYNVDIVSESYGWSLDSGTAGSAHNQHLSMTAQGMTYMCASGDSGAAGTNGTYAYPGYDPEVLGVGGTVATTDGNGIRISEFGWSGSGGGWSNNSVSFNTLPSWQHGTGVLTGINKRLQPDIAGHSAATNGAYYLIYNGSLYGISGTSCASPDAAGCLGTVEQRLAAAGQNPRFGRIQDLIYSMNGRPDVWYDIVSGNNGTLPNGNSSNCTTGWDTVTGWGAPNWDGFYNAVAPVTALPSSYQIFRGTLLSGDVNSLAQADGNYLVIQDGWTLTPIEAPIDVIISGNSSLHTPSKLTYRVKAHVNIPNVNQIVMLFNVNTNAWETVDTRAATQTDQSIDVVVTSNPGRFVAGDGTVQARIQYMPTIPPSVLAWTASIDQAVWILTP